jgi:hypothetical protein
MISADAEESGNLMCYEGRKTGILSENTHDRRACPKEKKDMHANFGSSE